MTGSLFKKTEDIKRQISQLRAMRFGPAEGVATDVVLAQLAACAEELNVTNPYPAPSKAVDLPEGQQP